MILPFLNTLGLSKLVIGTSLCISLMCGSAALAQEPPLQQGTLEQAIADLDRSIAHSSDPESAEQIIEAAAAFAFRLEQEGIDNAAGQLTLGNAYFIAGDLGRAILHYRKGLRIDPSNTLLKENLAHARSFVEPAVPDEQELWDTQTILLAWQRVLDRRTFWVLTLGLGLMSSCLWSLRILTPRTRVPAKLPIITGCLFLFGIGLLGYDHWILSGDRTMVITTPGTVLMSGPGHAAYQAVYDGPLGIGTEAITLERREGWIHIRLGNNQEGWIAQGMGEELTQ